jgi:hypothetical protein
VYQTVSFPVDSPFIEHLAVFMLAIMQIGDTCDEG